MTLMQHPVSQDWKAWAAAAAPRTCKACDRQFAPNHPRRRHCGLPDCTEVARDRRAATAAPAPPQARFLRRRAIGVQGVLGDVLVAVQRQDGQADEVATAVRELAAARKTGSRGLIYLASIRLMAATSALALTVRDEDVTGQG